jgi:endoglycosylceramidase
MALLATGCRSDGDHRATFPEVATSIPVARLASLDLRPLHVADQRIVDDRGRQVLLRGANVNALGEYYQADPAVRPTAPVTDADWDAMAANGFSVVRLIVSWSSLERQRGGTDPEALSMLRAAVESANQRGIYVVVDMHQDAWGMAAGTPPGTMCPDGTRPVVGWDGAPEWASILDEATTCLPPGGRREDSPAVQRAFANFYANADGIADRLTAVWADIAAMLSKYPGVAGYNLLNEPNPVEPRAANQVAYSRWLARTVQAIRDVERAQGAPAKPVFVEPLQLFPLPYNGLLPAELHDDNLVFAPHNYAESIQGILTIEQTAAFLQAGASELGAALWIGEYGFWDTRHQTLAVATRYAAEEDRRMLGGAWWQWRQTCGDPHAVRGPGMPAIEDQVHLITRRCAADPPADHDTDVGPTRPFLRILGRGFPRAAPGHLTELSSDPDSGRLVIAGSAAPLGESLVVWIPDRSSANADTGRSASPTVSQTRPSPQPRVSGLSEPRREQVDGGWVLTATATQSDWRLELTPS